MGRYRAVPGPRSLVPVHAETAAGLPRRVPVDRARPRALDPATEAGMLSYLDEHSATFWAAYYAAMVRTSTASSVRALRRRTDGAKELPAPRRELPPSAPQLRPSIWWGPEVVAASMADNSDKRFGMPLRTSTAGQLDSRPSLFERPDAEPVAAIPDCTSCGGTTEVSFLDLETGAMRVVCTACSAEVELSSASTDPAQAGV